MEDIKANQGIGELKNIITKEKAHWVGSIVD